MSDINVVRIDTYRLPDEAEGHLNGRPVRLVPESGEALVVYSDTSEVCHILTLACRLREITPIEEVEAAMSLVGPEDREIATKMGVDLKDAYFLENAVLVHNFVGELLS